MDNLGFVESVIELQRKNGYERGRADGLAGRKSNKYNIKADYGEAYFSAYIKGYAFGRNKYLHQEKENA